MHVQDSLNRLRKARVALAVELGRSPTDPEVAEALGITGRQVELLRCAAAPVHSLDEPVGRESDEPAELADFIADPSVDVQDATEAALLRAEVRQALAGMPERHVRVLWLRFGLDGQGPRSLGEIGQVLGVSRERIRQIERDALRGLRYSEGVRRLRWWK